MFSRSPSSSSSERSLPMSPPTRGRGSTMKSPQVIQASPKTKPSPARTAAARKAAAARYDQWQLQSFFLITDRRPLHVVSLKTLILVRFSEGPGGMAGMATSIPILVELCSKAPPGTNFVFADCPTNILLPAPPLPGTDYTQFDL